MGSELNSCHRFKKRPFRYDRVNHRNKTLLFFFLIKGSCAQQRSYTYSLSSCYKHRFKNAVTGLRVTFKQGFKAYRNPPISLILAATGA